MCNFWNFFPFSENVDYHMQFLEFLSLLHKCGLSYAISKISFSSPKTWTIISKFYNLFLFSKNVDYHMKFLEFLSLHQKRGLSYSVSGISFPSQKRRLSYAIYEISFSSQKTWIIICNLWNFFPFSKNVDHHMRLLEFLSLLQKRRLSYAISRISFSSP